MIWANVLTAHQRWMARFLRRRGWVVFYLEEHQRSCPAAEGRSPVDCWLALYQAEETRYFVPWDRPPGQS
jgi:hypothetical protein